MKTSLKLVFIIILLTSKYCISQSTIPNISLKANSGKLVNIKDFTKDKIVILNFWATWCAPCINELNNINDVYREWQNDTNVILLAISIDDSRSISRVMPMSNSNNWDFKILFDKNQELKRALNIADIPHQIAIHNGVIFYRHSGYVNGQENILIKKIKEHLGTD